MADAVTTPTEQFKPLLHPDKDPKRSAKAEERDATNGEPPSRPAGGYRRPHWRTILALAVGMLSLSDLFMRLALLRPPEANSLMGEYGLAAVAVDEAGLWSAHYTLRAGMNCPLTKPSIEDFGPGCFRPARMPHEALEPHGFAEADFLSVKLAAILVPFLDGRSLLRGEMGASDNHCSAQNTSTERDQQVEPAPLDQRLNTTAPTKPLHCARLDQCTVFTKDPGPSAPSPAFPLPSWASILHLRSMNGSLWTYAYRFGVTVFVNATGALILPMVGYAWNMYKGRHPQLFDSKWRRGLALAGLLNAAVFANGIYNLAATMAKADAIGTCMAQFVQKCDLEHTPLESACSVLFSGFPDMPDDVTRRMWSLWRGYLFSKVTDAAAEDFIVTATGLELIWSLYVVWVEVQFLKSRETKQDLASKPQIQ